jgi:hypothetical protein
MPRLTTGKRSALKKRKRAGTTKAKVLDSSGTKSAMHNSTTPVEELHAKNRKTRRKLEVDSSFIVESPSASLTQPCTTGNAAPTPLGSERTSTLSPSLKKKTKAQIFQDRIEQLKAFKLIYGNSNPSQSHDAGLYRWCHRKRTSKSTLTQSQILDLDAVGFTWDCKSYNMKSFEERIKQLREFRKIHNHCRVTVKYDVSLSVWCQHLKSSYRAMMKGSSPIDRSTRLKTVNRSFGGCQAP